MSTSGSSAERLVLRGVLYVVSGFLFLMLFGAFAGASPINTFSEFGIWLTAFVAAIAGLAITARH